MAGSPFFDLQFPVADVNPLTELVTNFLEDGHLAEPEPFNQTDAGLVGKRNASDQDGRRSILQGFDQVA